MSTRLISLFVFAGSPIVIAPSSSKDKGHTPVIAVDLKKSLKIAESIPLGLPSETVNETRPATCWKYRRAPATVVEAAKILQDNPKYRFFIYGDGAQRTQLEQMVKEQHITNVVFKEKRIRLEECAWVVSQAKVNIMNYAKNFGRMGVSSGKMFQYLAAGKPIVCNIDIKYDNVIEDYKLGVARDITTAEDLAIEIQRIAELPKDEYKAMCQRVRDVAYKFDYKVLAEQEIKLLD